MNHRDDTGRAEPIVCVVDDGRSMREALASLPGSVAMQHAIDLRQAKGQKRRRGLEEACVHRLVAEALGELSIW